MQITITRIEKPEHCPYLTVAETLRQNGDRHVANGRRYLAEGKTACAAGSFRKAQRNYDRADRFP